MLREDGSVDMKRTAFWVCGFLVIVLALTWVFQGNDFFLYKFFAPRQEAVRREVFETSRAFNQGMVQELQSMRRDYVTSSDPEAKKALASVILHRVDGFNLDDPIVPQDLRSFVNDLRAQSLTKSK